MGVVAVIGIITAFIGGNTYLLINVLPFFLTCSLIIGAILALYRIYVYARQQEAALSQFALVNNIAYKKSVAPHLSGFMFQQGDDRKITASLTIPTESQPIEVGNYQYATGSGKNRVIHTLGYMHLKLPRKVPHMVLDATSNDFMGRFSNLPALFKKDQELQLEGDFNNYFTLYAPKQYERDALYVFTPDVMRALVDLAGDYDVELVDDDIFLYSARPFTLVRPEILQGLLLLASRLSPEFESQTDRYADERIANFNANIVSTSGRRLKTSIPWLSTSALVAYIVLANIKDIFLFSNKNMEYALYLLLAVAVSGLVIWQVLRRLRR